MCGCWGPWNDLRQEVTSAVCVCRGCSCREVCKEGFCSCRRGSAAVGEAFSAVGKAFAAALSTALNFGGAFHY